VTGLVRRAEAEGAALAILVRERKSAGLTMNTGVEIEKVKGYKIVVEVS